MGDTDPPLSVQNDDAAVSIDSLFQVIDCFLCDPLRLIAGLNSIRCPFRENKLHNRLTPPRCGCSGTQIVRIATASNQRGIAKTPRSFV